MSVVFEEVIAERCKLDVSFAGVVVCGEGVGCSVVACLVPSHVVVADRQDLVPEGNDLEASAFKLLACALCRYPEFLRS